MLEKSAILMLFPHKYKFWGSFIVRQNLIPLAHAYQDPQRIWPPWAVRFQPPKLQDCSRLPVGALVGMRLNKANLKKVLILGSKVLSPFMQPTAWQRLSCS